MKYTYLLPVALTASLSARRELHPASHLGSASRSLIMVWRKTRNLIPQRQPTLPRSRTRTTPDRTSGLYSLSYRLTSLTSLSNKAPLTPSDIWVRTGPSRSLLRLLTCDSSRLSRLSLLLSLTTRLNGHFYATFLSTKLLKRLKVGSTRLHLSPSSPPLKGTNLRSLLRLTMGSFL